MGTDDKNSGFQTTPMFLLEKLNQIYADDSRTRKFDPETKKTLPNKQQPASIEQLKQPMKNSSLKGLLAAALLLVSSSAFAQVGSLTASASAVIVEPVNITKDSDLNFGTLAAGFVKTVSTVGVPSGTATASGDESAAQFEVTKGANVPVKLDVSGLVLLNGQTELPAIFEVEAISTAAGSDAVAFEGDDEDNDRTLQIAGGGLGQTVAPATSLTGTSALKVRIGGTVSPAAGQAPGTYSGTITLTAVYN